MATSESTTEQRDRAAAAAAAAAAKPLQWCLTLCDPMDCSPPPGSSVCGISQARILELVLLLNPKGSAHSRPSINTC